MFGDEPAVVARAFAAASRGGGGFFEHVVFAVFDRQVGRPVFGAFAEVFGRSRRWSAR
ncbi:hypothetical protein [Saccharothrix sp.]|uniref:hypothetical protein n=1 Tax=Saccharothrix sp. TaxID=1873460 RepID=UPI0028123E61|nr:hypothetical protein [Saccharothrix sp.]